MELPEENLVAVEEEFLISSTGSPFPLPCPVGHPPYRLLDLGYGLSVVYRRVFVPLLKPLGHLGIERWRLGVEERAKPPSQPLEFESTVSRRVAILVLDVMGRQGPTPFDAQSLHVPAETGVVSVPRAQVMPWRSLYAGRSG